LQNFGFCSDNLASCPRPGKLFPNVSEPAKKPWKQPLITAVIVVLGSVAIFFPAWLPDSPTLPTEDGVVEGLQFVLLLATAAFWFGASRPAGRIGPFYQIMGAFTLAAALGEADSLIEKTTHFPVEFFFIPLGLFALFKFKKNREHFGEFFGEFSSHPAAGFFASAFMLIYVLARFLGTSLLWKASLGDNYHPDVPNTVEAYLELLACYLLLVGTIGLCLGTRSHDPTEFD
jgi:hypothetical protein